MINDALRGYMTAANADVPGYAWQEQELPHLHPVHGHPQHTERNLTERFESVTRTLLGPRMGGDQWPTHPASLDALLVLALGTVHPKLQQSTSIPNVRFADLDMLGRNKSCHICTQCMAPCRGSFPLASIREGFSLWFSLIFTGVSAF
jgi:hypothetical protein